MTVPYDDLHPILRELVLQSDEDSAVIKALHAAEDAWRPLLAHYGITGADYDALLRVVNATCGALATSEARPFRDPISVASNVLTSILLGIRLERKGLVGKASA